MMITFRSDIPLENTMIFEGCYEDGLKMDFDEKLDILNRSDGFKIWMLVDGRLIGESYGVRLSNMDEEIEDCDDLSSNTIYCYSTTILPWMRGHGLGIILKAHWLGMCRNRTPLVVGHSTSNTMKNINEMFGAVHTGAKHEKWYGTDRVAWFYRYEF